MNDSHEDHNNTEVVSICDYNEMEGNLITLAQDGMFDVVAHGCNIYNTMGAGIAPQMAKAFNCDEFALENEVHANDFNKLGQIDWEVVNRKTGSRNEALNPDVNCDLAVVNCYTQTLGYTKGKPPIDYEALALCMRKVNNDFKGRHIGLPMIGAGLAGGDWERIKGIIKQELVDMKVTVVMYKK